jgi:carboxylate-amine ligase
MMDVGTGADRQLAVFEKTNSLPSVVEYVQSQFLVV